MHQCIVLWGLPGAGRYLLVRDDPWSFYLQITDRNREIRLNEPIGGMFGDYWMLWDEFALTEGMKYGFSKAQKKGTDIIIIANWLWLWDMTQYYQLEELCNAFGYTLNNFYFYQDIDRAVCNLKIAWQYLNGAYYNARIAQLYDMAPYYQQKLEGIFGEFSEEGTLLRGKARDGEC